MLHLITARQEFALSKIREAELRGERLSLRELGRNLGVGVAAAHGMVDRLYRAGLVTLTAGKSRSYKTVSANADGIVFSRAEAARGHGSPTGPTLDSRSSTAVPHQTADSRIRTDMTGAAPGSIPLYQEGMPAGTREQHIFIDPQFFGLETLAGAFAIGCTRARDVLGFVVSPTDVLVMNGDYPPKVTDSLVAAVVDGIWTIGGFKPSMRREFLYTDEAAEKPLRVSPGRKIVRGYAIGLIARRGGHGVTLEKDWPVPKSKKPRRKMWDQ